MLIIEACRIQTTIDALNDWMNADACTNAVSQPIEGESVEMVRTLTPLAVAPFLRRLPDDHSHRAGFTA